MSTWKDISYDITIKKSESTRGNTVAREHRLPALLVWSWCHPVQSLPLSPVSASPNSPFLEHRGPDQFLPPNNSSTRHVIVPSRDKDSGLCDVTPTTSLDGVNVVICEMGGC